MKRDLRDTPEFQELKAIFEDLPADRRALLLNHLENDEFPPERSAEDGDGPETDID